MFALNQEGKFLYISETVSIYLGLSQVRARSGPPPLLPGLCMPLPSAGITSLNMENRILGTLQSSLTHAGGTQAPPQVQRQPGQLSKTLSQSQNLVWRCNFVAACLPRTPQQGAELSEAVAWECVALCIPKMLGSNPLRQGQDCSLVSTEPWVRLLA